MTLLLRKEIKNKMIKGYGYIFEIHKDHAGKADALLGLSFDFGNKIENEEYRNKFDNGKLDVFAVLKIPKCQSCGQAIDAEFEGDWVCGIHAENEHEALEYYLCMYE